MNGNRYYTLGRSGLRVSRIAFGALTFGNEWGIGSDKPTAQAMFDQYLEAGGNFIDTADVYNGGTSEAWLGEFARERGARDRLVIATKYGFSSQPGNPNASGNGRKNLQQAVEGSLKRLGTDYIDLLLVHAWDRVTPVEEVMRGLDDLVRAGKVRYIGLSNVPAWYAARAQTLAELRGWAPVTALQYEYSLVQRDIEDEFIPLGNELGMGMMVWSPLASGLLSGKYRPSQGTGGEGNGRLDAMRDSANPVFHKFTERNWAIVAELERVSQEVGRSMAQVALNWVANRPGVGSVIAGATRPSQLADNLQALDFVLPDELRARLDAISQPALRQPYLFFADPALQGMLHGASVGDKPVGYWSPVSVDVG